MALMLRNTLVLVFSPDLRSITPSYSGHPMTIGGIVVDPVRLAALAGLPRARRPRPTRRTG